MTGELDDEQAGFIGGLEGITLPPLPLRARHPGALAELAWRRWQAGELDEAAQSNRSTSPADRIHVV